MKPKTLFYIVAITILAMIAFGLVSCNKESTKVDQPVNQPLYIKVTAVNMDNTEIDSEIIIVR